MQVHPLRAERIARGWSQQKLADLLGVTTRTIIRWEQGQILPYPYYREQLCALFEKNADELGLLSHETLEPSSNPARKHETVAPEAVTQPDSLAGPGHPHTPSLALIDPLLPSSLNSTHTLLGREHLLAQLKTALFQSQESGPLALNGLPGVGKTSLAVALASDPQVQDHFPDGILWASLGPHPNVPALLARWGNLLGLSPNDVEQVGQISSWSRALHAIIAHRRFLIIIDDAWSIEDAFALQVGGTQCAHLLTTRLPPIAVVFAREQTIAIPELTDDQGVKLLARYVPRVVQQEEDDVQELVHVVGGLPLALTLMGKYLAAQAFAGQPRRLQHALQRLRDVQRRLELTLPQAPLERPAYLQNGKMLSLQAAIAMNDQLLSEQAHAALLALSVFPARPNTFGEPAALAVSAASEQNLDELWDAGLLESSTSGRYTLHQTISDYARMQRLGTGAEQNLVRYMRDFTQQHQQDHEALEGDLRNILAALDAANRLEMRPELVQSVLAMANFLYIRGLYELGGHYIQQGWEAVQSLDQVEWKVSLLRELAAFHSSLGNVQRAQAYALQGLELARQTGLPRLEGDLLHQLARLAEGMGTYAQSKQYCQEGLALADRLGDHKLKIMFLSVLGAVKVKQGELTEAYPLLQEGLRLARHHHDQEQECNALVGLVRLTARQSNFALTTQYGHEGLQVARALGHRFLQCVMLNSMAAGP